MHNSVPEEKIRLSGKILPERPGMPPVIELPDRGRAPVAAGADNPVQSFTRPGCDQGLNGVTIDGIGLVKDRLQNVLLTVPS